jgi:hypothetical protein
MFPCLDICKGNVSRSKKDFSMQKGFFFLCKKGIFPVCCVKARWTTLATRRSVRDRQAESVATMKTYGKPMRTYENPE